MLEIFAGFPKLKEVFVVGTVDRKWVEAVARLGITVRAQWLEDEPDSQVGVEPNEPQRR